MALLGVEAFGGQPAGQVFKLTPAGKRQLAREQSKWDAVVRTVARVMRPSEGG